MTRKHPSYMTYMGHNSYKICSWSAPHGMYRESMGTYDYFRARAIVGTENCRNPKTCHKQTHQHEFDSVEEEKV